VTEPSATGYAPVNEMEIYWESYGDHGTPLLVLHEGFGLISMSGELIERLAESRRVIALELQGHGHTRDIGRPFSYEAFGDDVAGVLGHLGVEEADLMGYSLGAGAGLRAAIQHPGLIRRLAVGGLPFRRDGWFPEVRASMDQMSSAGFTYMQHSPQYDAWSRVAPDPDAFPALMDKMGDLLRQPYDWSDEIRTLSPQTLLIYADADSVPLTHVAEFFALLGGGIRDASWDGSARPEARLAILPGLTHYDISQSRQLADTVDAFFGS
jgi:pimeloyl-ACP methyl ester carboxylesterase